jgi:4-oxalocrotonate tautomerase
MPILNFKFSVPEALSESRRLSLNEQFANQLTNLTQHLLLKKGELTALVIEQVPSASWYIGGQSLNSLELPSFSLDIKVTEGTNTKDQKASYIAAVFEAMRTLLGLALAPTSYVVIHEVRADSWGYGGLTQERRYIDVKSL